MKIADLRYGLNADLRQAAAKALWDLNCTSIDIDLEMKIAALRHDSNAYVRQEAAEALRKLSCTSVDIDLEIKISDLRNASNADSKKKAAKALGETGGDRAIAVLIQELRSDPKGDVSKSIAEALEKMSGTRVVDILIDTLKNDRTDVVKRWAAWILGNRGETRAVQSLIVALSIKSVRLVTVDALGKIGDHKAIEPLVDVLNDDNNSRRVRQVAVGSLDKIGGERVVEAFIHTLKSDSDWVIRGEAAFSLGKNINFNTEDVKRALRKAKGKFRPFLCLGGDENSTVRKVAKESLKKHKTGNYSLSVLNIKGPEEQEKYITTYKKEVSVNSSADIQASIGGFEQTQRSQVPEIPKQVKEQFARIVDILTSKEALELLGLTKEILIDQLDGINIYYNINKKSLADNNAEAKKIILDKEAFKNDSVLLNELLHETLHIVVGNDESAWQGKTKEELQQDESFKAHKQLELRLYLAGMYLLLQTQGQGFAQRLTEGYAGLDDKFMELELDNYLDTWKYSSFIRNIIEKLQAAITEGNTPVAFDSIEDILKNTNITLEGDKIEDTNSVLNSFITSAMYA